MPNTGSDNQKGFAEPMDKYPMEVHVPNLWLLSAASGPEIWAPDLAACWSKKSDFSPHCLPSCILEKEHQTQKPKELTEEMPEEIWGIAGRSLRLDPNLQPASFVALGTSFNLSVPLSLSSNGEAAQKVQGRWL